MAADDRSGKKRKPGQHPATSGHDAVSFGHNSGIRTVATGRSLGPRDGPQGPYNGAVVSSAFSCSELRPSGEEFFVDDVTEGRYDGRICTYVQERNAFYDGLLDDRQVCGVLQDFGAW